MSDLVVYRREILPDPTCAVCGQTFATYRLRGAHERWRHPSFSPSPEERTARREQSRVAWRMAQGRSGVFLTTSNRHAGRYGQPPIPTDTTLAEGPCVYCGGTADSWDHVVPLSKGGAHVAANLVPCCWPCNKAKSRFDAESIETWTLLCGWCWTPLRRKPSRMARAWDQGGASEFVTCSREHLNMIRGYQPLPFGHPNFPRPRHVEVAP